MKENCRADGTTLRESPIETTGSIGVVERYHNPLRASFAKINTDDCLSMEIFYVNNTVGTEVQCPTLLFFGSIPCPIRKAPSPT